MGSGGDIKAALNGAVTGALFGYAGTFGGDTVAGSWSAARYAAHATAGCISGELAGGSCGSGAASALAGKLATNLSEGQSIFAAMAAGGTASVVTGGKFTNGAMTAGFAYVFNHCSQIQGGCWSALKDAASMTYDWATGRGADNRVYGPGSIQVIDMMDAPGVNKARDFFTKKMQPILLVETTVLYAR